MEKEKNILIAVSNNRNSLRLLRYVNKNLTDYNVFVVHFGFISAKQSPEDSTLELIKEKAQSFGYKFLNLPENNVAEGIKKFVNTYNISVLVMGNAGRSFLRNGLYDRLVAEVDCEILTVKLQKSSTRTEKIPLPFLENINLSYVGTILLCLATLILFNSYIANSAAFGSKVTLYHLSMTFILVVVYVSMAFGMYYGIFTSVLSALSISFFFVYPQFEFKFANADDIINTVFFIVLASIVSFVGGISKKKMEDIKKREISNQLMMNLSTNLVGVSDVKSIRDILTKEISELLDSEVVLFITKKADKNLDLSETSKSNFSEKEIRALQMCFEEQVITGVFSDRPVNNVHFRFIPVSTAKINIGVFGIEVLRPETVTSYDLQVIDSVASLAASALERAIISRELVQMKNEQEREKLRADLLSSVSHDLKTPLSSVIGSLTAIEHMKNSLNEKDKETLRKTALEEAIRLNGYISNILDMTKFEAGSIKVHKEEVDVDVMIGDIVKRMKNGGTHKIVHERNKTPVKISVDVSLFEQVIQNLLDNAMKYTDAGKKIIISAKQNKDKVLIDVADEGPGIPDEMKEKIFDKFERIQAADKKVAGTGLGLSICRNIMNLMDGRISVNDNDAAASGSVFRIEI